MAKDFERYDDEILLKSLKERDITAFNKIYSKYWQHLYLYAYNLLDDRSICEDIIQDIFTQLYSRREYLNISNLKSYLFQSVKYKVINHFQKNKLMRHHIERIQTIRFTNQTEESINFKQLDESITKCIAELPGRCQEIFLLSRYEHLSSEEIACQLGLSVQTVKNQISKGLKYLHSKLDQIV